MTPREIKIARNIKRQKKAGLLKNNGGVDVPLDQIKKTDKWPLHKSHKNKGGIHKQNDPKAVNVTAGKYPDKKWTGHMPKSGKKGGY